jgi:tetratricopeptide (TPR) repeat protein
MVRALSAFLALVMMACSNGTPALPTAAGAPWPEPGLLETPLTADGYFSLGNDLYQGQQFDQAVMAYEKAIDLDSGRPEFYANLGVSYYNLNRMNDAIRAYQSALALTPEDAELHYLLGAAYLQQKRLDEAAQAFNRAIALDAGLAEPYYGLGVLYRLQGDRAKAIAAFEKFLEIGPSQDQRAIEEARRELEALGAGQ